MTDDNLILQQLREINYPGHVDVTDAVMRQVANTPLTPTLRPHYRWRNISIGVAACAVLFVAINITRLFTHNYNEAQICSNLFEIYDYHADYGTDQASYYSLGGIETFYE